MSRRSGMTLLELVVVIAIAAVLIALLLPAILKARIAGLRAVSMNNLKQISIATHNFADAHEAKLPTIDASLGGPNPGHPMFFSLLPYIEQGNAYIYFLNHNEITVIRTFISPADPTATRYDVPVASYAANAQMFSGNPSLSRSLMDGASNTIAFAEHYAWMCSTTQFFYMIADLTPLLMVHRPTFADGGTLLNYQNFGDVYPVTQGLPPVSIGSDPGETFQVAPRVEECNPRVAQSPDSGGMLAALADGSVRILAGGMSPTTYWSAVTPAGGEVLGSDW